MKLWEKVELSKLVIGHALLKYPRVFATCSFGKDSSVLVDLALRVKPELPFYGVDTGYEFEETLSFAEELVQDTRMNFRWVRPSESERIRIETAFAGEMIKNDRYKCCEMKVPALAPVLKEHDAWITGLRRDENAFRQRTPVIDPGNIVKVNPLAFWTKEDVWSYIVENRLKYHPLYDQGYASLGCRPCTVKGGDSERGGRFAGTSRQGQECGLHSGE